MPCVQHNLALRNPLLCPQDNRIGPSRLQDTLRWAYAKFSDLAETKTMRKSEVHPKQNQTGQGAW